MTLNKSIKYKKEKRKPYRGAKAVDPACRNHKGCPWCEENRTYQSRKEKERMKSNEQETILNTSKLDRS